jgi:hypothetical protein
LRKGASCKRGLGERQRGSSPQELSAVHLHSSPRSIFVLMFYSGAGHTRQWGAATRVAGMRMRAITRSAATKQSGLLTPRDFWIASLRS